jgi:PAS domain S-box-containing protein
MRAITDNLGEGTYALDLDGRVTFMNPAAERMLGWTAAELHGKDMHETIHFQHADGSPFPREACPLLQVIGSGEAQRIDDDTFTRSDGTMFPVAYVSSPILMGGVLAGAVLAFHDISQHKALDEALRRSEREAASRASQLMAIFESMADGVLVYGRDGQIVQTNGADADIFAAHSPASAPPHTLEQRDQLFAFLDEDGQPLAVERWPTTRVLNGETLRGANAMDLLVVRAADGREVVVNASGAPIRDAEGEIVGGVLIGRDVTQRRQLERQAHEALLALMSMAGALVSSDDRATESALASPQTVALRLAELARVVIRCERVGVHVYNLETQVSQTLAVAGLTEEQARVTARTARLNNPQEVIRRLQAGEVFEVDLTEPPYNRWANPLGSRSVLLAPVSVGGPILGDISVDFGPVEHHPTPDEFAMASAVAQLAAQVIERERLARDREAARANVLALAEITRQMDEFLGIAAHELRSPVTNGMLSVTLAMDTLRSLIARADAAGAEHAGATLTDALQPIEEMLERTADHMERLSRLVVDLLDVSRIRAGKLELRVAPCDLTILVREVVAEQRRMAPARMIRLQLPSAPKRPAVVMADADRIRQVVTNYLTNAVKYSDADQHITVRLHLDDEWARVSVQDGGPGIPTSEQHRVWERFYRVAGAQAQTGGGVNLGLGLYVSRMIIEQHQGRVGVHSARRKGAIFWFALQLLASDA